MVPLLIDPKIEWYHYIMIQKLNGIISYLVLFWKKCRADNNNLPKVGHLIYQE